MQNRPLARTLDTRIADAGDEIVLYDGVHNHYHTLNATAARVWTASDGARTPSEIARHLELPIDIVGLALSELAKCDLLHDTMLVPVMDRRAVIRRLAAAGAIGAVALPVIASISGVESVSAAVSCANDGESCVGRPCCPGQDLVCFNGLCTLT